MPPNGNVPAVILPEVLVLAIVPLETVGRDVANRNRPGEVLS